MSSIQAPSFAARPMPTVAFSGRRHAAPLSEEAREQMDQRHAQKNFLGIVGESVLGRFSAIFLHPISTFHIQKNRLQGLVANLRHKPESAEEHYRTAIELMEQPRFKRPIAMHFALNGLAKSLRLQRRFDEASQVRDRADCYTLHRKTQ